MRHSSIGERILATILTAVFVVGISGHVVAQPLPETTQPWTYTLLEGSQLTDDCPICDRLPTVVPMRGKFDLQLIEEHPLYTRYAVQNISFTAGAPFGHFYKMSGQGTLQVGGEVALVQAMSLEVEIDNGATKTLSYMTNVTGLVERLWPMIKIQLLQTNGTQTQVYELELAAAPLREIWFSTKHGFHPGEPASATNYVSGGDLISSAGRVVKRQHELTARLGFMPVVPDLGLDALDILPKSEIGFSTEEGGFSETLGIQLHEGDALSNCGRVLHSYADLIGAFGPEPPPADQGLDALHTGSSNEIYFSIEQDFFSEILGRTIRRGDLLSGQGLVLKTNEQLIARFNPSEPKKDYGLDALWVWPSGEIWFSTEEGFYGQHFEHYGHGDLLSDQGYVVFRNLELLNRFAPLEDLADFGLDGLFIVSDATPLPAAPRFNGVHRNPASGVVVLQWQGEGRVFQVERAGDVAGPFAPLSEIVPELSFEDTNSPGANAFYRLRHW